jgi:hypothetical protein
MRFQEKKTSRLLAILCLFKWRKGKQLTFLLGFVQCGWDVPILMGCDGMILIHLIYITWPLISVEGLSQFNSSLDYLLYPETSGSVSLSNSYWLPLHLLQVLLKARVDRLPHRWRSPPLTSDTKSYTCPGKGRGGSGGVAQIRGRGKGLTQVI